jgi:hypothetical protein
MIPLTFEAVGGTVNLQLNKTTSATFTPNINVCSDKGKSGTWSAVTNLNNHTFTLQEGETVSFRGVNDTFYKTGNDCWRFRHQSGGGQLKLYGNIDSIIQGADFIDDATNNNNELTAHCFDELFWGIDNLIDARDLCLPYNIAPSYGFYDLFGRCYALTAAP